MADEEITKREFLKASAVFVGGVAIGEYLDDDTPQQFVGGGGAPPSDRLLIESGAVHAVGESIWFNTIVWEESGGLVLDDGDSLGLVNGNE